ncbi:MAG: hypothetical protein HC853_14770 [Anaerolineae bacterium]|nr:hypothetical protein [Anaerolineae bacterium]
MNDGTIVNLTVILHPGESSTDIGMIDVDELLPYGTTTIEGHSQGNEYYKVSDLSELTLTEKNGDIKISQSFYDNSESNAIVNWLAGRRVSGWTYERRNYGFEPRPANADIRTTRWMRRVTTTYFASGEALTSPVQFFDCSNPVSNCMAQL